ncbi:CsbD family protein [Planktothrix sp. FACHB-1355]|uniref:CsbD family protein n=1 Tax=Aerosakkonema funiforme FACHB-1375 TaxID=2949571 RepID=A0A926VCL2_9CYAN|nr:MULTISPECIES: CsbD family protein [Oscillatoriales]MBD2181381.1 CsbD family protein [Aerosakkonema funiforme FACHB-1375]MBD3563208.1 CsbD family protein [Planktothrix sp. FACHB-1355]
MSLQDKAKAIAKNIEGKAQEVLGNITDNPKHKAEGKAKQIQAEAMHTVENLKDKAKNFIDKM